MNNENWSTTKFAQFQAAEYNTNHEKPESSYFVSLQNVQCTGMDRHFLRFFKTFACLLCANDYANRDKMWSVIRKETDAFNLHLITWFVVLYINSKNHLITLRTCKWVHVSDS